MGVDRSDYILVGANLDVTLDEDFYDDNYDEYMSRWNHEVGKIAYLDDRYSGKYFIVGIPLKVDKDGYNGLGMLEFGFNELIPQHTEYVNLVREHVKEKFNIECEPKLIIMTHWT